MTCRRCLVVLAILIAGGLRASVYPRLTVEDLVDNSSRIIEGHVGNSYSSWDPAHKFIWTHYEISVADMLRGGGTSKMIVSEPGGSAGDASAMSSGSVGYLSGEHVVLFLYRTPIGYWRTAGGGQGKFTVDPNGHARANLVGQDLVDRSGGTHGTSIRAINGLPLNDLKREIRRIAASRPVAAEK